MSEQKLKPGVWVRCEGCGDWWCTEHQMHAADCECPTIDEWAAEGVWPYSENTQTGGTEHE